MLKSDPATFFYTFDSTRPIDIHPGRDFSLASYGGMPMIFVDVESGIGEKRFGERVRAMLMCQPPVYEIWASTPCYDRGGYLTAKLSRATGITMGDIVDLATKLQDEHRTCDQADREMHDGDGFVKTSTLFRAINPMQGCDPWYELEKKDFESWRAVRQAEREKMRTMTAYMDAKAIGQYALVLCLSRYTDIYCRSQTQPSDPDLKGVCGGSKEV